MSTLLLTSAELDQRLRTAQRLIEQGKGGEAAKITAGLLNDPRGGTAVLHLHTAALTLSAPPSEALPYARRLVEALPRDFPTLIRLLALLDTQGLHAEVDERARLALSRGGGGPTLQLLHGRALAALGKLDEAERSMRAAVVSAPDFVDAHHGLANLVWSRTGDAQAALRDLDAAIDRLGAPFRLLVLRSEILHYADQDQAAYETLNRALAEPDADPMLHFAASQMALPLDADLSAGHAEAAKAFAGAVEPALLGLCEARLAQGRGAEAETEAEGLLALAPQNQHFLALKATAERMQGKPGWRALYDYEAFVRAYHLAPPRGWTTVESFLADLAMSLIALHTTQTHPVGQSVRHGTQTTQNLLASRDRAIRGLFQALDAPIRNHIRALGVGADPLRRRNLGGYAYAGAWSVRLQAGGGRHADHVHPQGWISSACYIQVPKAVEGGDRAGWITFGHAATPTKPDLPAEHFVKPEEGKLVLFPSYMWHGVNRFEGDEPRLTVAFDLVPSATTPTFD